MFGRGGRLQFNPLQWETAILTGLMGKLRLREGKELTQDTSAVPALEPAISPRSPGFFVGEWYLETKICA